MINILIVEDDLSTRKFLQALLVTNGYNVYTAGDGLLAWDIIEKQSVDFIICDIMMPNMDGFEFVESLRDAQYEMPVLMLTAKTYIEDKKRGYSVGSDDYMTKPVNEEELLLKITALLRRAKITKSKQITVGSVLVDYDSLTVTDKNESIELPPKEFMLLFKLLSYQNKIFTRLQIMDEVWGMDTETDDNTINVHVNRLRKKLSHIKEFEIMTIRGLGYKAVKYE